MVSEDIDKKLILKFENVSLKLFKNKNRPIQIKDAILDIVTRKIKKENTFWALKDVSFSLYRGNRLAIMGMNGSGKTTLLKIVAGIYKPTEGTIQVKGRVAPLIELGAGFQGKYTGVENIYLYGAMLGMDRSSLHEKEKEILEFAELQDFRDVPVENYSSGMRARLGFSICSFIKNDILILDEVLSVGDAKFRAKSEKRIEEIISMGTTVMFVSHSLEQAKRICDTAMILDHGEMKAYGGIDEVASMYSYMVR